MVYVSQTVSIFIHGNLVQIFLSLPWGHPKKRQVWKEGEESGEQVTPSLELLLFLHLKSLAFTVL